MVATIEELRLYAKEGDSPSEILNLQRLLAVAVARVDRYAPDAPQIDKDQAAYHYAAYMSNQPSASGGVFYANAWRYSGAVELLKEFKVWRVGKGTVSNS